MSNGCFTPPMSAFGQLRRSRQLIGEDPVWADLSVETPSERSKPVNRCLELAQRVTFAHINFLGHS